MEQTVKKKFGIRDIMTIAAMMVITYLVAMVIGSVTLPLPVVYLYGSAGIDAFIGAIFYLVAANRVNKHGGEPVQQHLLTYSCNKHEPPAGFPAGGFCVSFLASPQASRRCGRAVTHPSRKEDSAGF